MNYNDYRASVLHSLIDVEEKMCENKLHQKND